MMKVLITGTASGVGKATAEKYLRKGYEVYGLDMKSASIQHPAYKHAVCDVSEKSNLPDWSGFDTVINNAGTPDDKTSIKVNLEGYINVAEHYCFQPAIKAVVNIGSLAARAGVESIRYCSSQGGRVSLTKWLARELGRKYGARVNCISLGAVKTSFEPEIYNDNELYGKICRRKPVPALDNTRRSGRVDFLCR